MNRIKTALALLLTMLFIVSSVPLAFAADAYDPTDPYIYDHNVTGDEYDGPKFQYFSAYVPDYAFDNVPSGYVQVTVFTLYNTITHEAFPAYCTDINVPANSEFKYRRLNLEDSTFAGSEAGLLRAILNNGFYLVEIPDETMAEHEVRVAEKLKELGDAAGVPDLTIGEAVNATQTAIWRVAHGPSLSFPDHIRSYIYSNKTASHTKYYDLCDAERINGHIEYSKTGYISAECDEWINTRIRAVYDYLISLEPIAASQVVVSPYSFVATHDPVLTKNSNGTYNVSVTASIDVHMESGDDLTLSAVLDETHFVSAPLKDGKQLVTLTLENVPANMAHNEITLAIDGNQTIAEPVLYEALGGRDLSQSMIGADHSRTAVHAQVLAQESRSLSFYKTTVTDSGNNAVRQPLQGITFDVYFAAEMSDYLSGAVVLPEAKDYDTSGRADFTITTDENGLGTINFSQHGYADGMYLVVEREHPVIREPIAPFYVAIPMTNANGEYEYAVTVQPKNEIKGDVKVEKDIGTIGNDKESTDVYSAHSWIICTTVPEDIADGKSFTITDVFDNRLDYAGNVKMNIENVDGTEVFVTLTPDEDYVLTVHDFDSVSEGHPSDSFVIELTHEGMVKIADTIGTNDYANYRLRVHFDAKLNANVQMGTDVPNSSLIEYVNSVNFKFEVESEKSYVNTGAVNFKKVDASNNGKTLQGAEFELYRLATEQEVADKFEGITYIDGVVAPVVKVSFFASNTMRGSKVTTAVSDDNGDIAVYGLAYGKYYLVETKAPDGYNVMGGPLEIDINADSHKSENTIVVENMGGIVMPGTGGIGTTVFTFGGVALMLVAIVLLVAKKRMAK